jgi:microcystin-dependent protein
LSLSLPNDIINDTTADASPVQQNYSVIEQYINSEVINRDGSVAMNAPLLLVGDPTQPLHAVPKQYVDAVLPVGIMMPYGGVTAPGGGHWALCNGASVAQADFPELFAVVGNKFGTAAAGAFLLPNTVGRMLIGIDASEVIVDTVGKYGGSKVPPLKTHTHDNDHDHGSVTSGNQNADHVHSNGHDHGNFVAATPAHTHAVTSAVRGSANAGSANSFIPASSDGTSREVTVNPLVNGGSTNMTINIPPYVGNTGGITANHQHVTDLPKYVGVTSAPKETVETVYHPPFMVVTYIIRMK